MDIIDRIVSALDRVEAEGRKPGRLLLGHREVAELERALYGPWLDFWFTLSPGPPGLPPTLFDVPVERVDQPTLIGVISEE